MTRNWGDIPRRRVEFDQQRPFRKRRQRLTVEKLAADYDYIDVSMLRRRGMLTDSWVTLVPLLRWKRIVKIRATRYLVSIEFCNRVEPQQIRVSWTPCHFGGARPWLHCSCGRRVARLFKGLAGYYCRECFDNPRYASQSKSTQGRLHFELCKLRLRLNGIASLTEPFPERPSGMHRKTYERLRNRAKQLESQISRRVRARATDYPNLVYYLPSSK